MNGFATWLAASRLRRILFIAGLFPLPLISLLSLAVVVMSAALNGWRDALLDVGAALALLAGLAVVSGMDPAALGLKAFSDWSVSLGLGALLRWSGSVSFTVQAAVLLALLAMLVFSLAVSDTTAFWYEVLERLYADLGELGVTVQADVSAQAALMTGVFFAGTLAGVVCALLIGNRWAGAATGAPMTGRFSELRLGYAMGGLAAAAGLLAVFGVYLGGVLMVFGAAFVFQGLAVLVWWALKLGWPRGWWLALGVLPLLAINLFVVELALLAAVGFVDNWYGLRRPAGDGNMV